MRSTVISQLLGKSGEYLLALYSFLFVGYFSLQWLWIPKRSQQKATTSSCSWFFQGNPAGRRNNLPSISNQILVAILQICLWVRNEAWAAKKYVDKKVIQVTTRITWKSWKYFMIILGHGVCRRSELTRNQAEANNRLDQVLSLSLWDHPLYRRFRRLRSLNDGCPQHFENNTWILF